MDLARRRGSDSWKATRDEGRPCWHARSGSNSVLPLLVGRGTRIAEYLLDWDKTYLAGLRLGEITDTQDATELCCSARRLSR